MFHEIRQFPWEYQHFKNSRKCLLSDITDFPIVVHDKRQILGCFYTFLFVLFSQGKCVDTLSFNEWSKIDFSDPFPFFASFFVDLCSKFDHEKIKKCPISLVNFKSSKICSKLFLIVCTVSNNNPLHSLKTSESKLSNRVLFISIRQIFDNICASENKVSETTFSEFSEISQNSRNVSWPRDALIKLKIEVSANHLQIVKNCRISPL